MRQTLLTIALLHWIVLATPGANFLLVGQLAAGSTRRSACAAVLGITCVTLSWALLAVLGVGAVFSLHPLLRLAAQLAGGAYLLLLASRIWRSGGTTARGEPMQVGPLAAFRMGFLTNILNPKTALFFGSVFATALPARPGMALTTAAVALVWANAVAWHLALALVFSQPRIQRGYLAAQGRINRVAGALVGAFGLKLLWETAREWRQRVA